MSEGETQDIRRETRSSRVIPFPAQGQDPGTLAATGQPAATAGGALPATVSFNRAELNAILALYGRMVAAGEWRDYALDFLRDKAVFSIFRRASEMPLFRVEKEPRLAKRQGAYSVVAASGLILKRGRELAPVLRVLDKPLRVVGD